MELQDIRATFCCVSLEDREVKFKRELNKSAFEPLINRCEFASYEQVENDYKLAISKTYL